MSERGKRGFHEFDDVDRFIISPIVAILFARYGAESAQLAMEAWSRGDKTMFALYSLNAAFRFGMVAMAGLVIKDGEKIFVRSNA